MFRWERSPAPLPLASPQLGAVGARVIGIGTRVGAQRVTRFGGSALLSSDWSIIWTTRRSNRLAKRIALQLFLIPSQNWRVREKVIACIIASRRGLLQYNRARARKTQSFAVGVVNNSGCVDDCKVRAACQKAEKLSRKPEGKGGGAVVVFNCSDFDRDVLERLFRPSLVSLSW
jgi:hypothetical protein